VRCGGGCSSVGAARESGDEARLTDRGSSIAEVIGLLEVRYPENNLKQHLKTYVTLAAVAMLIVVSSWIGLLIWGRLAGPTVDETGIVTVVAHVGGNRGKQGGAFPPSRPDRERSAVSNDVRRDVSGRFASVGGL
jgi:hypothetical protein